MKKVLMLFVVLLAMAGIVTEMLAAPSKWESLVAVLPLSIVSVLGIARGLYIGSATSMLTRLPASKAETHVLLPVSKELAADLCFGNDPGEWEAFCAGWQYHRSDQPEPFAKELGLYPENQNLRISWERGWDACRAVTEKLGGP